MSSNVTTPVVLDGASIAGQIKAEVAVEVAAARELGYVPSLAVIVVGDAPALWIYVRNKMRACEELGIYSETHTPSLSTTTEELLRLVESLNARKEIDGILIQLPLPAHVDTARLLEAIAPEKDVDGFHPMNTGRLLNGSSPERFLAPCTPAGVMEALRRNGIAVRGRRAVVIGRSNIVGKPLAVMLMNASATVTICHSQTVDLGAMTRKADILVAAIGRPGFVTPEMVQPGATIIDVGINRITTPEELERFFPGDEARHASFLRRGSTLVGDVDPAAFAISGAYTPVPGGVGLLTIAMLMSNTVKAARMRRG